MKAISEKQIKRIILEVCLFAVCAVLALGGAGIWLKTKEFAHIRELAVTDSNGLAVFDETARHYIFWIFNAEGRLTDKIREAKTMTSSGSELEYSGMAVLNEAIYLQRKTYSDDGNLIRESIVKKTKKETVEIFDVLHQSNDKERYFIGDLSVHDGKLFFMQIEMRQNAALLTLFSFDESNGVSETAILSFEVFKWNYTPAYIGNGNIIFADDDSVITAINISSPNLAAEPEKAGAVQSLAVGDDSYAYFDLYSGDIVLNTADNGILRANTDKLLSPKLCLRGGGVMAIELDEQRNGKNIFFVDLENLQEPEWSRISPDWFAQDGMREALIYALCALLTYAALRIWLFLLVERHIRVTLRIVLIVAPLAVGCSAAFYYLSYLQVYHQIITVQEKSLKSIIQKGDKIERLKERILECGPDTPAWDERYIALANELFDLTGVEWNAAPRRTVMYYGIITAGDNKWRAFCFGSPFARFRKNADIRYLYKDTALDILRLCIEEKAEGYFTARGEKTYYLYQTPVVDKNGKVVAALEIGIDVNMIRTNAETVARRQAAVVILIIGVLTGAFIGVINLVLRSLRSLKSGVERITRGERNVLIAAATKDELGEIADAFNLMSAYVDEKSMDDHFFHRFVPEEISALLGRTAETAALGDHADLSLAVLCLDMRGFYHRQTKPVFERLEYCHNHIVKAVRHERGYLRQMDGSRSFSLFSAAVQALEAALEICGSLPGSYAAIDYGGITVAILGEDSRFQTVVVSDVMERQSVLQYNARTLGAKVLLTHEAFCALEAPDIYRYRFLGIVRVDGFSMKLYDFFDADDKESLHMKSASLNDFNAGVELFYEGRKRPARDKFIRALKLFPGDTISRRYLSLCEEEGENCLTIDTERS